MTLNSNSSWSSELFFKGKQTLLWHLHHSSQSRGVTCSFEGVVAASWINNTGWKRHTHTRGWGLKPPLTEIRGRDSTWGWGQYVHRFFIGGIRRETARKRRCARVASATALEVDATVGPVFLISSPCFKSRKGSGADVSTFKPPTQNYLAIRFCTRKKKSFRNMSRALIAET